MSLWLTAGHCEGGGSEGEVQTAQSRGSEEAQQEGGEE